jgi:hypothetical protein
MFRDHSQHNGHKLVDIVQAIVDSQLLLLPLRNRRRLPSGQPSQPLAQRTSSPRFRCYALGCSASAIGAKNRRARHSKPASRKGHPQHSGLEQYVADHNASVGDEASSREARW